jgi:hypothetical protein
MRIVLNENLPRPLIRIFDSAHQVATVHDLDLTGTSNTTLIERPPTEPRDPSDMARRRHFW